MGGRGSAPPAAAGAKKPPAVQMKHAGAGKKELLGAGSGKLELGRNCTEAQVRAGCRKALKREGPAVAMRYPKDLDRLRTFYECAQEAGKALVISRKTAHLLEAVKGEVKGLPEPGKGAEVYGRELKKYSKWEQPYLEKGIPAEEIMKRPGEYVVEADFWSLGELVDFRPQGGVLVHSMSEPFEEQPLSVMAGKVLQNWVDHFNMEHLQRHASGHASQEEIFSIVKELGAGKVFPVHTKHSGVFSRHCKGAQRMSKGKRFEL